MWRNVVLLLVLLSALGTGCGSPPPRGSVKAGDMWRVDFPLPPDFQRQGHTNGYWRGPNGEHLSVTDGGVDPALKDDVARRARLWIDRQVGRDRLEVQRIEPFESHGHPAARTRGRRGNAVAELAFVVVDDHMVVLELLDPKGGDAAARMSALVEGLHFDAADGTGTRHDGIPDGRELFWKVIPVLVLLVFTSAPAWLGATNGWMMAEMTGQDPRSGAASGAFNGAFRGVMVGVFIVSGLLFLVMSQGKESGGIMSPIMGWFLISLFLGAIGLAAAVVAGFLAMIGASVGARRGGRSGAALGAALFAAPGAVAGVFLLSAMPGNSRRRHSQLPPPVPVRVAVGTEYKDADGVAGRDTAGVNAADQRLRNVIRPRLRS